MEMKFRELRKLMDVLGTWGNINCNGKLAQDRLNELCEELISNGMTIDEIDTKIKNLDCVKI